MRQADSCALCISIRTASLTPTSRLRRALAPESDSVIYQDRIMHVASWAARFLFTREQLSQPVGRLSGGERARVLIAQLMLQPADVLLLDEPTNDLDIPTLEILEESLLEFRGALVLVTHDRYMLDRVSTVVLGLDGLGMRNASPIIRSGRLGRARKRRAQRIKLRRGCSLAAALRRLRRRHLCRGRSCRTKRRGSWRRSSSALRMLNENCRHSTIPCSIRRL